MPSVKIYESDLCVDVTGYCKKRKIAVRRFVQEIINAEFTNYHLLINDLRTTGVIYLNEYKLYIQPQTLKTQLRRRGYNTVYDPQRNKMVLCETNMPKNWTKFHPYSQQG
jgi:hypothetical protein